VTLPEIAMASLPIFQLGWVILRLESLSRAVRRLEAAHTSHEAHDAALEARHAT